MAKLISLALLGLVAALLLVADASIVRTTITTTEIEEDNPRASQRECPEQLRGKQFNSCQRYLSQSSTTPYDILRVVDDVNPSMSLQQCCEELQQLQNPWCSCDALKKIIRQETQRGSTRYGGQQQEMKQMLQKARSIPEQCQLEIRSCHFQEY